MHRPPKEQLAHIDAPQLSPNPHPVRWLVRAIVVYLAVFVIYTVASNPRFEWGWSESTSSSPSSSRACG